jgi:hypothetical protein
MSADLAQISDAGAGRRTRRGGRLRRSASLVVVFVASIGGGIAGYNVTAGDASDATASVPSSIARRRPITTTTVRPTTTTRATTTTTVSDQQWMTLALQPSVERVNLLREDWDIDRYRDELAVVGSVRNASGKAIRAYQLTIVVKDVFGVERKRLGWSSNTVLEPGGVERFDGYVWSLNQFDSDDTALRGAFDSSDPGIGAEVVVRSVLFADGSQLGTPS